jgi:flavin reductase (DIM6/NTAB) family NADH-FMN oxidoreductase RutF
VTFRGLGRDQPDFHRHLTPKRRKNTETAEKNRESRCRQSFTASGPDGRAPVLTECPRWFAARVVDRFDPGDHLGLVLAPIAAECQDHGPQLGFQALHDLDPGHPA